MSSLLDPILQLKANLAPLVPVPGVAESPGWQTVAVLVPPEATRVQLEVSLSVSKPRSSDGERHCRLRVIGPTLAPIALSTVDSTTVGAPVKLLSRPFALAGGTTYQVQAECTGGNGPYDYAMIFAVRLIEAVS